MKAELLSKCKSFINNRDIIREAFTWENGYFFPVCASIFTDADRTADPERMKYCLELLKEHTGVFSNFRGIGKMAVMAKLSITASAENKLKTAVKIYETLREHFSASDYLVVAAMIFAELEPYGDHMALAARAKRIFKLMKEEHPFLTSSEDSIFAALLALSEGTEEDIIKETEECYRILDEEFAADNALQALSHVLALSAGEAETKSRKTIELYNKLKDKGYKYGKGYELAILGALAMIDADMEEIVQDIIDADGYLSEQKGYSTIFGAGKKTRLMHAAMIVSGLYKSDAGDENGEVILAGATLSAAAAQQAALCASIASVNAAVAASVVC